MNPTALVTGGSRGIGRGVALALSRAGFDVLINYVRNADAAARTATDCVEAGAVGKKTVRVDVVRANISEATGREALIRVARERLGRLDLLVNNAGVAPEVRADVLEAGEESFDRVIGTNLKGPYFLTQLAARWMIEQVTESNDRGDASRLPRPKIVVMSSISAYTASVNRGDYCIAKAGLAMVTKLFASRLAEHGIGVYEIRPGIIETDMTHGVKDKYDRLIEGGLTPIRRWGQPEDVGRAVVAVAEDRFPFSTGEAINVDGGFHLRIL